MLVAERLNDLTVTDSHTENRQFHVHLLLQT